MFANAQESAIVPSVGLFCSGHATYYNAVTGCCACMTWVLYCRAQIVLCILIGIVYVRYRVILSPHIGRAKAKQKLTS